jgi:hypothetical protein
MIIKACFVSRHDDRQPIHSTLKKSKLLILHSLGIIIANLETSDCSVIIGQKKKKTSGYALYKHPTLTREDFLLVGSLVASSGQALVPGSLGRQKQTHLMKNSRKPESRNLPDVDELAWAHLYPTPKDQ